jgi:hypothetical protein
MRKIVGIVAGVLLAVAPAAAAGMAEPGPLAATGLVGVVQAVPDATVAVTIDGRTVTDSAAAGEVLGPYPMTQGRHRVDFTGAGDVSVQTSVQVGPGSNQDVVLHRPATVGGAAVVNTYETPIDPIGPGKSRVLVAHTATVAPADVQVDGTVVFENIANGEFAIADVPAGRHVVALFPTGDTDTPILGPLDVDLTPGTVTMVYAVGNPEDSSMDLVVHTEALAPDGSVVPASIDTGSAGFARWLPVRQFGPRGRVQVVVR